jgi:hypothetical protein
LFTAWRDSGADAKADPARIGAVIVTVRVAPLGTLAHEHVRVTTPVPGVVHVPLSDALMLPALIAEVSTAYGRRSTTRTFDAVAGPLFTAVRV